MTRYFYEFEDNTNDGRKILNVIVITNKTIKQYFKFQEGSGNLVCIGNHYLFKFYGYEELKEKIINNYKEITKDYILNY